MSAGGGTLGTLSGYVFAELDRLNAVDVADADVLELEVKRAKATEHLVRAQVEVVDAQLDAVRLRAEFMGSQKVHVPQSLLS